jgi:hypothetical protein
MGRPSGRPASERVKSSGRTLKKAPLSASDRTRDLVNMFKSSDKDTKVTKKVKKSKDSMKMLEKTIPKQLKDLKDDFHSIVDPDANMDDLQPSIYTEMFKALYTEVTDTANEFRPEKVATSMQRACFGMVLSMIPIAQQAYEKSKRESAAYALNAFINQARELSADLKLNTEIDGQVDNVIKIIRSVFLQLGQVLLTETSAIKTRVDTEITEPTRRRAVKKVVDESALSYGKYLSNTQESLISRISAYMAGDLSEFETPATLTTKSVRRKNSSNRSK